MLIEDCGVGRTVDHYPLKASLFASACIAAFAFVAPLPGHAQTVTWQGTVDDDWTDGANWSGGLAPTHSDTFVIVNPNGFTSSPVIDGDTGEAQNLFLGSVDGASLTISGGGELDVVKAIISNSTDNGSAPDVADETGFVTVTGNGSSLSGDELAVGYYGTGTLTVVAGGDAEAVSLRIGGSAGADGGVTVDGLGSTLTVGSGRIGVGVSGTGTLTVSDGALAMSEGAIIGWNTGSSGTAAVHGADSRWENSDTLYVGNEGNATLAIGDGGVVTSTDGYVATGADTLGIVTIDGAGSGWDMSGVFTAGHDIGSTAHVTLSNGGMIRAVQGTLGNYTGSSADMTVSGTGSKWSAYDDGSPWTGFINVGLSGNGDLVVSDGGAVEAVRVYIGNFAGSSGTILLTDTGSSITTSQGLYVGSYGDGELTLTDGAHIEAQVIKVGYLAGSIGTLNVGAAAGQAASAAGTIDTDEIVLGTGASRLVLNHTDSDYVLDAGLTGGGTVDVLSGTTTLTGDSSSFAGNVNILQDSVLGVEGQLAANSIRIDSGGTAIVDGATATASIGSGRIGVGVIGNGTLAISNGANVTSDGAIIGWNTGSAGTASVSGAYSRWGNNGILYVGNEGGGTLEIASGGVVTSTDGYVGTANGVDGIVTIDGAGSGWNMSGLFIAGNDGDSTAGVTLSNGGTLNAVQGALGNLAGSYGTMIVSGAGSKWSAYDDGVTNWAGYLNVGLFGSGDLTVENGGTVEAVRLYIGNDTGSSGTVLLSGAGSAIRTTEGLYVGSEGEGDLVLANGAHIEAQAIKVGYLTGSTGTLTVGAAAGQTAVGAGTIDADEIVLGAGASTLVLNHTDNDYEIAARLTGTGTVSVLAGTTTFSSDSSSFAGDLIVEGGKVVLANATSAASATVDAGGMLQIGNGGTTGALDSDIQNYGTLIFSRSDALLHDRAISGSGDLMITSGSITLSGTNTFVGSTTIDAGATLALSAQGRVNQSSSVTVNGTFDITTVESAQIRDLEGSGAVMVGEVDLVITNASQVFSGEITGIGGLGVSGGSLTLTGANDFSGGLSVSSGATVLIGDGGTSGSITSDITNDGAVVFNRSDDYSYAGNITGIGQLAKQGAGLTRFEGSVGADSVFVQQGTVLIAGTLLGNTEITGDATLVFDSETDSAFASQLSGTGLLSKAGAGALTLAGDSSSFAGIASLDGGILLLSGTLAGDVIINAGGTLQVGDGVTDGNLIADTVNNGLLILQQTTDYDYAGTLSGDGGIIKRGNGTLLLSGDYSYTGSTIVEGGLVRLIAALDNETDLVVDGGTFDLAGRDQEVSGLSGTGGMLALGDGALTVVQAGNSNYGGAITGSGGFIKAGEGLLNLTGVSSFTGHVDINDGRLAINGVLPGSIAVNSGGALGGAGAIGTLVVRSGGMLAPGNSISTFNVAGDVTFEAGSIYEVEVDGMGLGDRLVAGGAAIIEGGTVSVIAAAGNYRWTSDYVILSAAGGVTGAFTDTDVDLPFLTPYLRYDPNEVVLTLVRNDHTFTSTAITPNQRAVALALDTSAQTHSLYRSIAGQTDIAGGMQAFDALSGELWATAGTFMVDRVRRFGETVVGRMEQADTVSHAFSQSGSAATQTRGGLTAIWGQAIGSWDTAKSDGNAARATQSTFGFVTGMDTAVGDWRVGVAFSHAEDKVHIDGALSEATIRGSGVAVYAGGGWGALRIRLGASYSWLDVNGARKVVFPSVSEAVLGVYDGKGASAFGEVSYELSLGRILIEPFAGLNHVRLKTDAFAETGGAIAGLDVAKTTRDVTYTALGIRLGTVLPVSERTAVTPHGSVAWTHGFGDVAAEGRHSLSTGQAFSIEGLPATRNALRLEAGVQANMLPGGSLGISYVGNVADRWSDHGLKLGFSYSF